MLRDLPPPISSECSPNHPEPPSSAEITALTARLRTLSHAGAAADPGERARFLADKDALIARIVAASSHADPPPRGGANTWAAIEADDALAEVVRARAADGGYALVGPSARTWRTDPATGRPAEPVDETEHQAMRQVLIREEVTTTEPAWHGSEIVSTVLPAADPDTDLAFDEFGLTDGGGPLLDAGPALTAEEAAHELVADGRTLAQARGLVRHYLDEVSERVGASVHQWGLDETDLTDIRAHAAHPQPAHPAPPAAQDVHDEHDRRHQLNQWHAQDAAHNTDAVEAVDALTRDARREGAT